MNKCLNCGKEIAQKEGARERKFCDNLNACKQAYHNKNKKEKRYVQFGSFQALKDELDKAKEEINELKFAKSVPEKKGHKYPLEEKDMLKSEITYQEPAPKRLPNESGIDFLIRQRDWHNRNK